MSVCASGVCQSVPLAAVPVCQSVPLAAVPVCQSVPLVAVPVCQSVPLAAVPVCQLCLCWCACVLTMPMYRLFPADESAVSKITSNRLSADDFKVLKVIGRGAFGEVQLVSITSQ